MAKLVELTNEHSKLKVVKNCSIDIAEKQHIVNLQANEIGKAVSSFPVFLTKNQTTSNWTLSAVTSLEQGRNLFVEEQQWTANFQPIAMQAYPFFLMRSPKGDNNYTIGIDEESDAFSEQEGEPLFDGSDKPSLYLTRVTALLEASVEGDFQTHAFTSTIEKLQLYKSVDIQVYLTDGGVQTIKGLLTVDEDKMQSLTAEQLEDLNKKGYLLLLHALLVSLFQLNRLVREQNRREGFANVKQVKMEVSHDSGAEF